ncbi:MAG: DNA-binding protein [Candidatus Methanoperedens sp.]|nr:DNA-binding protein [Candidatus Methanoperedens sp.]
MEKTEKIMDREIAWRIFAHEFNRSNLHVSEGDERAPNYIITPTGVKCNRLFIVGVVTEVENIGKDNNLWRARIADPTGVFTVYAGQYQPEAAIFLSELQVPAYVAIVGKARKYEPEDGSVYISVRPEEINTADEKQRDRWVLDTAERTLERIKLMEEALNSGLSGNELREFLQKKGASPLLADGAARALQHYKNLDKIKLELKNAVIHAIKTITTDSGAQEKTVGKEQAESVQASESSQSSINEPVEQELRMEKIKEEKEEAQSTQEPTISEPEKAPEPKEAIAAIIDKLDTGKGISYSSVVETAMNAGIKPESVEAGIKELMDEGRCYEPKIGVLRKV